MQAGVVRGTLLPAAALPLLAAAATTGAPAAEQKRTSYVLSDKSGTSKKAWLEAALVSWLGGHFPYAAYPELPVSRDALAAEEEEVGFPFPARALDMTYPVSGQAFSDMDAAELTCDFASGIPWAEIRKMAWLVAEASDVSSLSQACAAGRPLQRVEAHGSEPTGLLFELPQHFGVFADASNDCFLGLLSYVMAAFLCVSAVHGAEEQVLEGWWKAVCLFLEAVFFYLEVPLASLAASPWPVPELVDVVGRYLLRLPGAPASRCDGRNTAEEVELLSLVRGETDKSIEEVAAFSERHAASFDGSSGCFFSVAVALIVLELHLFGVGRPELKLLHNAFLGIRMWTETSPTHFIYDVVATRWPIWRLLSKMRLRPIEQLLTSNNVEPPLPWQPSPLPPPGSAAAAAAATAGPAARCGAFPRTEASLAEVDFRWPWRYKPAHVCEALRVLEGRDIIFMSTFFGSELQMSYALRARQVARGLRRLLRLEARVCLSTCRACCDRLELCDVRWRGRCRVPAVVVHVKGICECATSIFPKARGVVHVIDPVDRYLAPPPLFAGSEKVAPYREVSGVFAETSTAAAEYRSHPSVEKFGWQVFHLPHHHSNLARRTMPCRKGPLIVGVHSSKVDPELRRGIENLLETRFPDTRFRHVVPKPSQWRVKAGLNPFGPGFTEPILEELRQIDVSVVKPNCYAPTPEEKGGPVLEWRAWLCERHHSGQRLVHALSVGQPVVVWGSAQGHADALRPARAWPVAWSNEEMLEHLAALLSNQTLRCALAAEAPALAEPYHLTHTLERYTLAFAVLLSRGSTTAAAAAAAAA